MCMVFEDLLRIAMPGTVIPKPKAEAKFLVKGVGMRRGEQAIVYAVPNHIHPLRPGEKGINISEFEAAYKQLMDAGELTREWFRENLPECDREGTCNFTTVGGLFVLLGKAKYDGPGRYARV